jgi:hypothetical protein
MDLEKEIELLKEKVKLLEKEKELESDLMELKKLADKYVQPYRPVMPIPYPMPYYPMNPYNPWYVGDWPWDRTVITC